MIEEDELSFAKDRRGPKPQFFVSSDRTGYGSRLDILKSKLNNIFDTLYPNMGKQKDFLIELIISRMDTERKNLTYLAIATKMYDDHKANITPDIFKNSFNAIKKHIVFPIKTKSKKQIEITEPVKVTNARFKSVLLRYVNYVIEKLK